MATLAVVEGDSLDLTLKAVVESNMYVLPVTIDSRELPVLGVALR
jgi:hypothetical protein